MKFDINAMLGNSTAQNDAANASDLPIDSLVPYHNHQFTLYSGERLNDMVESIKKNGVLIPIIVHPVEDYKYEILAGHNRVNAAKLAGLTTVPAIVKKDLTDAEIEMYVIETNAMQRGFNDLKLSEQAAVLSLRHSKMFDEAKCKAISEELYALEWNGTYQTDATGDTIKTTVIKPSKLAAAGEEYGLGKNTVARLIRLNKLLTSFPEYTLSVNEKFTPLRAAVELSYISKSALAAIYDKYKTNEVINNVWEEVVKINDPLSKKLRELFKNFSGNKAEAEKILNTLDKSDKGTSSKLKAVKINPELAEKYFSPDWDNKKIQEVIAEALEMYYNNMEVENKDTDIDNAASIDEVYDFSAATSKALKRQRINTVGELMALMERQSDAENVLGIKAVDEILEVVTLE